MQHSSGSANQCNKARIVKGIKVWKKDINLPLFTDVMIVYVEKSKEINEVIFKKISGSKVNIQRLIIFL